MNIRIFLMGIIFTMMASGIAASNSFAQDNYDKIDRLALNAPASAEKSIKSLAHYFDLDTLSDKEKTRAVYRWITDRIEYDIDAFLTGWPAAVNPKAVLVSKRTICGGYTSLFCRLLSELDIPCKIIEGYARSFASFKVDTLNNVDKHAWNAVFLEDKWWMSDLTFSLGTYDWVTKKFTENFNDGYFLVKPDRFIYNHFPFDQENQFLKEPVTFKQFTHFPSVSRYFFNYKIDFQEFPPGEITAKRSLSLNLTTPDNSKIAARLEPAVDDLNSHYARTNETFEQIYTYGLNFDLVNDKNQVVIKMEFHEERPYFLYCFARNQEQSSDDYKALAVVKINNREAAPINNDILNLINRLKSD